MPYDIFGGRTCTLEAVLCQDRHNPPGLHWLEGNFSLISQKDRVYFLLQKTQIKYSNLISLKYVIVVNVTTNNYF